MIGKMDKIGIKRRKIWEVLVEKSKKLRKMPKSNKHTGFNNCKGWIFSTKTINALYLISMRMHGLDFGPKNNKLSLGLYSLVYFF